MNAWQAAHAFRFHARDLERRYPGVALLLDAYALVDLGVERALKADGRTPVCHKGCGICCNQPIPVTPLELLTVHTFARMRLPMEQLDLLQRHFVDYDGSKAALLLGCPFLIAGSCSVYAVRPIACRQFMMFERPCKSGEDPTQTRPDQVLVPQYAFMHEALRHTLPWYSAWPNAPATPAASQAFFKTITTVIQSLRWQNYRTAHSLPKSDL